MPRIYTIIILMYTAVIYMYTVITKTRCRTRYVWFWWWLPHIGVSYIILLFTDIYSKYIALHFFDDAFETSACVITIQNGG